MKTLTEQLIYERDHKPRARMFPNPPALSLERQQQQSALWAGMANQSSALQTGYAQANLLGQLGQAGGQGQLGMLGGSGASGYGIGDFRPSI